MTPSRAQVSSTFVLSGSCLKTMLGWPRRAFSFEAWRQRGTMRGGKAVSGRLAAIVAAEVAGYSRLIEAGDAGTLAGLKSLRRDLIDPKMALDKGHTAKTTGDGGFVEFASGAEAAPIAA